MVEHKLSLKALAFAGGVLWGLGVLVVGMANLIWPDYGIAFLELVASVYPGYHADPAVLSVLIGTGYAVLDGAICGLVFGLLYNVCAWCGKCGKE